MVPTSDAAIATSTTSVVSISDATTIIPIRGTSVVSTMSDFIASTSSTVMLAANTQGSSDEDGGSSVGIIAGCVIGVVLCITLLLVVIILLWCYLKRRTGKLNILQGEVNVITMIFTCVHMYV